MIKKNIGKPLYFGAATDMIQKKRPVPHVTDRASQDAAGRALFLQIETVVILDQQMRQANDVEYPLFFVLLENV